MGLQFSKEPSIEKKRREILEEGDSEIIKKRRIDEEDSEITTKQEEKESNIQEVKESHTQEEISQEEVKVSHKQDGEVFEFNEEVFGLQEEEIFDLQEDSGEELRKFISDPFTECYENNLEILLYLQDQRENQIENINELLKLLKIIDDIEEIIKSNELQFGYQISIQQEDFQKKTLILKKTEIPLKSLNRVLTWTELQQSALQKIPDPIIREMKNTQLKYQRNIRLF